MDSGFDMNVNSDELDFIKDRLTKISNDLYDSVEIMRSSIQTSSSYLSGKQFEKAQYLQSECLNAVNSTNKNIINTIAYLAELQEILEEYFKARYDGGAE